MWYLNVLQKVNNVLFKVCGVNSVVLELQVFINSKRSLNDVPDLSEVVYSTGDDDYVQ